MNRKRTLRRTTFNLEVLETRRLLSTATDLVSNPYSVAIPCDRATPIEGDSVPVALVQSPSETLPADLVPTAPSPSPERVMPIAGEEISPLAELPQAPPTSQPTVLPPPTDCPTNLPPTDPNSGDSLPQGTANPLPPTPAPPTTPAPTPTNDPTMPENPSNIPPTDPYPLPPIGPDLPASTTPSISPTLTAAATAAAGTLLPQVQAAATGLVGAGVVAGGLTGCNDVVPFPVDPNNVPIPAPPSSATNPPAGLVPPSSASPVPYTYHPYPSRDAYTIG